MLLKRLIILALIAALAALGAEETQASRGLKQTSEILVTSASGAKLAAQENVEFSPGTASGTLLRVFPELTKQTLDGIGSSLTESSAFVLAHLDREERAKVLENIFGAKGASFSLTRTHIGACDFSVKGRYSYADVPDDAELRHFNLAEDSKGFDPAEYPGIRDPGYDLLPLIKEALAVKSRQADPELRIVASAWTAPPWMKDIQTWYIPGAPDNNWQGTGGNLLDKYVPVYADYIVKYLDACAAEGVRIWGLSPVNEPHGVNGQWESMNFSPESQNEFIKTQLGPKLWAAGHSDKKLLIYDQNRDGMEHWADVILADPATAPFVYGTAIHWYESTFRVYEDVLERVHNKYPGFAIMHTEGCIDDLGKDPPGGVTDPGKFKEQDWFQNDAFWWSDSATDWAYSVTWQGVNTEDHPAYTPVHRYARNIIKSLDNWASGWIDWNVVLDSRGGPNHVGNFCGAPVMIDTETREIYYTPVYYILAQFSRTIRPGDQAVQTELLKGGLGDDDLHACATVGPAGLLSVQLLNTTSVPIVYQLQIGEEYASLSIGANSLQTVRVQLPAAER